MSVFKRKVLIDGEDITTFATGRNKAYITAINSTETIEKKKVFINNIPFSNGQIDASYAFGNINFYNAISFAFTVEIISKMSGNRTRSNAIDIYRKINSFISNKIGKMEIETNDEIGVIYKATHINSTFNKEPSSQHIIVTFNFMVDPYKTKKIGGKQDFIECLDFNDMCFDDCWENAFYQSNTIPNELMFFKMQGNNQHVFVNVSDDVALSINDNIVNIKKGKSELSANLFSTENYLKVNKSIEFELYYTFETL